MRPFALIGLALVGLTLAGLALHVPGEGIVGTPARQDALVALMAVQAVLYVTAVRLVLRRPVGLWLVLVVAVAMRLPLLVSPPFLSSDINRYVWDGRVQVAGINPYRYVPDDPALAGLRDSPVYSHINRADYATTIYPPAAQVIFAAVGAVWQSVYAIKAVMVLFEALAVFCLLRLLAIAGLPASRVLIYAWNPLAAWAFAGNGHIDAAAIGFLGLTFLLRVGRRYTLAGAIFGAAALVKFLPAVVAPALWRPRSAGWRVASAALAVVAALYALYASAGWQVLGFLGGYGAEEGLDTGSGVWLLAALGTVVALPAGAGVAYLASAACGLALLGAWFAFRPHPPAGSAADAERVCADAAVLMTAVTVAISPHYPWYFPWLALPAVLAPWPAVVWLSVAPLLLYASPPETRFLWEAAIYLPALLLALTALRRRTVSSVIALKGNA